MAPASLRARMGPSVQGRACFAVFNLGKFWIIVALASVATRGEALGNTRGMAKGPLGPATRRMAAKAAGIKPRMLRARTSMHPVQDTVGKPLAADGETLSWSRRWDPTGQTRRRREMWTAATMEKKSTTPPKRTITGKKSSESQRANSYDPMIASQPIVPRRKPVLQPAANSKLLSENSESISPKRRASIGDGSTKTSDPEVMDMLSTESVAESAAVLQKELEAVTQQAIDAIKNSDLPERLLGEARKVQEDMQRDVERATEEAVFKLQSLVELPETPLTTAEAALETLTYEEYPRSLTAGVQGSLWPEGVRSREKLLERNTLNLLLAAVSPTLPVWSVDDAGYPVSRIQLVKAAISRASVSGPNRLAAVVRRIQARLEGGWRMVFKNVMANQEVTPIEQSWARRSTTSQSLRTLEIWGDAVYFIGREKQISRMAERTEAEAKAKSEARTRLGAELRNTLLKLGPTFIKIGQILSTRIDILPREYCNELSVLQDNCPRFSSKTARDIIESELGKSVDELFDTFEDVPLAAASLGQVHRATKDGKQLAVKVQRQGLLQLFRADLSNLKLLASLMDKFDPKYDGADRNWGNIFKETERLLYQEIDYTLEAANAQRFDKNFKTMNPELYEKIKVPGVYPEMTTEKVLVMEYVPGVKITDVEKIREMGVDTEMLSKVSAESYMTQLCRHGFFHCDPHPGNLAVDDKNGGRIIYYDFGMMDTIPETTRKGLVDFVFGVYNVDARSVVQAMVDTGIIEPRADMYDIIKVVRYFVKEFDKTLAKPRDTNSRDNLWENEMTPEEQKKIKRQRRQRLAADFFSVNNDKPFKFPASFTFVYRSFMSLDGIGKRLDKNYDMMRIAAPYLNELVDLKDGNRYKSILNQGLKELALRPVDIRNWFKQSQNVAYTMDVMKRIEEGELKLRTRSLEVEKSAQRIELSLRLMGSTMVALGAFNAGLILSLLPSPSVEAGASLVSVLIGKILNSQVISRALFFVSAIMALNIIPAYRRIKRLDEVPAWW